MKKKTALLLATLMLTGSCFTACGDNSGNSEIVVDSTRTQLYVANFDGGVGSEWLDEIIASFETKYANTSFENGKQGVQIIPDKSKSDHISAISNEIYNVIFTESVKYNELAATGKVLDITDIVTAVNEDGKTIESKLTDTQQTALKAVNNAYYALPHYEYYPGLTYDKDIFNKKQLYIKQGGGYTNEAGARSAGPDGKLNTKDDGLPATYEEFYALCEQMVRVGVTPILYTGQHQGYIDMLLEGLMAAYLGIDELELSVSFDSTQGGTLTGDDVIKTEIVTGFNGNTPIVEEKTITQETGYLMAASAGKYYALEFLEKLVANKDRYFSSKINSSMSHLDAQEEYIYSSLENKPVAMLIEGSYWYNEAQGSGAFGRSVDGYGDAARNRNFAWMPLPSQPSGTVTEANGKEMFLVDEANSYVVINANIKNDENLVRLAKLFVQYCYTDANLQMFTVKENTFKGVKYELTTEQYNGMEKYAQSLADLRGDGANVVHVISDNKIFVNAQSSFTFMHGQVFGSTVKGTSYTSALVAMKAGVSAKEYFQGMAVSENTWTTLYSKYFE